MNATKIIIRILLGIGVAFMAFICVKSVVTPIQFEEERAVRETQVIANLISLRTAEAQLEENLQKLIIEYIQIALRKI